MKPNRTDSEHVGGLGVSEVTSRDLSDVQQREAVDDKSSRDLVVSSIFLF